MGRRTILHLIPTLEGGGAERQLVLLANAQARSGHQVHIGLLRLGPNAASVDRDFVTVHQADVRGPYDLRLIGWALGLLRRLRPDVVHTWLSLMDVVGGLAALTLGTPWVVAEQASALAYRDRWQDRMLRPGIGRLADAVVANSEAGLAYWGALRTRHRAQVVIRNALDYDAIGAVRPADAWPGPDPLGPRILFAGRLTAQKNVLTLIHALSELRSRQAFSALILGDGPDAAAAKALVSQLGLERMVSFGGYRDDLWALMKRATVYVSPSRYEGQPNAILEALACGAPLIVSDIPEHREFLDAATAVFVPPEDAGALADALLRVITAPEPPIPAVTGRLAALRVESAVAAYDAAYQSIGRRR